MLCLKICLNHTRIYFFESFSIINYLLHSFIQLSCCFLLYLIKIILHNRVLWFSFDYASFATCWGSLKECSVVGEWHSRNILLDGWGPEFGIKIEIGLFTLWWDYLFNMTCNWKIEILFLFGSKAVGWRIIWLFLNGCTKYFIWRLDRWSFVVFASVCGPGLVVVSWNSGNTT